MSLVEADVVVIGAGPGGYAAAFMSADLGMKTLLIDKEKNPGGACLYRGCIPSKALLHAAKIVNEAREASHIGISFGQPQIDVQRLAEWKREVVAQLTGGLGQLRKAREVQHIQGTAKFIDANTLEVEGHDGQVKFKHAILATGSRPVVPGPLALDSRNVMTSREALELESIPQTLLVIGGGYIGLELGTVYAALGSKVTVVEMMDGLLPGADRDLVKVLSKNVHSLASDDPQAENLGANAADSTELMSAKTVAKQASMIVALRDQLETNRVAALKDKQAAVEKVRSKAKTLIRQNGAERRQAEAQIAELKAQLQQR